MLSSLLAVMVMPVTGFAQSQERSGVLLASEGDVFRVIDGAAGQTREPLSAGSAIFEGDRIETDTGAQAQIMMLDQSVVSLGESTLARIDSYRFAGGAGGSVAAGGKFNLNIDRGNFRILTGRLGQQDDAVTVNIKSAQVDINQGELTGQVGAEASNVVLLSGMASVGTSAGKQELNRSGWGLDIGKGGELKNLRKFKRKLRLLAKKKRQQRRRQRRQGFDAVVLGALSSRDDSGDEFLPTKINTDGTAGGGLIAGQNDQGQNDQGQNGQGQDGQEGFAPESFAQQGFAGGTSASPGSISGQGSSTNDNQFGFTTSASTFSEGVDTTQAVQVGSVTSLGKNADKLTYSITGDDSNLFSISSDGVIYLKQGAVPDFESNPTYSINVRGTKPSGKSKTKTVTFGVTDANDAPTAVTLSNNILPDKLVYNTVEVTSDYLLNNTRVNNNGEGWDRYHDESRTEYIDSPIYYPGPQKTYIHQTI
ncbi:MAG: cadherin repeat domain-containing protein, partial [Alphaproteobacteria bacterium]|nr:cadherin repeat domain-containing protein [Alphaproteobacteria bacterium]